MNRVLLLLALVSCGSSVTVDCRTTCDAPAVHEAVEFFADELESPAVDESLGRLHITVYEDDWKIQCGAEAFAGCYHQSNDLHVVWFDGPHQNDLFHELWHFVRDVVFHAPSDNHHRSVTWSVPAEIRLRWMLHKGIEGWDG